MMNLTIEPLIRLRSALADGKLTLLSGTAPDELPV